jgi:2-keto-3-deoxy-galactonokinase
VVSFGGRFLAVDWGTTNRRAYLIEDGRAVRSERDDRGVTAVERGESGALKWRRSARPSATADAACGHGRFEHRLALRAYARRLRASPS